MPPVISGLAHYENFLIRGNGQFAAGQQGGVRHLLSYDAATLGGKSPLLLYNIEQDTVGPSRTAGSVELLSGKGTKNQNFKRWFAVLLGGRDIRTATCGLTLFAILRAGD